MIAPSARRREPPVSRSSHQPSGRCSMRRMRRTLLASLLAAAAATSPSAQDADLRSTQSAASNAGVITPSLSPLNANYTITARLDPATRTIAGS